jgi:NAD(P)-dependent dehydrogenase (short-subunit alcohol dehydrogenase family)
MRDLFDLSGQVVIITGASQGIGRGLSVALAEMGATVVVASRRLDKCQEIAEQIQQSGDALALSVDVTDKGSVQELVRQTLDRYGKVDVLINNAGTREQHVAREITPDEWATVLAVNLTGPFLCCQAVSEAMIAQGRGKIVNISSILALLSGEGRVAYGASKAGLSQLTKALAVEWAKYGINVNAVAPALVLTPENEAKLTSDRERFQNMVDKHLVGRVSTPEDIAGTVIFLASRASDYITGQTIFVDGGRQLV